MHFTKTFYADYHRSKISIDLIYIIFQKTFLTRENVLKHITLSLPNICALNVSLHFMFSILCEQGATTPTEDDLSHVL